MDRGTKLALALFIFAALLAITVLVMAFAFPDVYERSSPSPSGGVR